MKLRLVVNDEGPTKTVEVHGELTGADLCELDRVCRPSTGLTIELSNLRHLDNVAAVRLREFSVSGAKLVGASPFISMLIEGDRN